MKRLLNNYLQLLRGRDSGTVAVTFLFSLPILLFIMSVIVQYAMIVNARIVLNRATAAAARSAMTALSTDPAVDTVGDGPGAPPLDGAAFVKMAACERLESISPAASIPAGVANSDAETIRSYGLSVDDNYGARYDYADQATTIHWQVIDENGTLVGDQDPPPAVLSHFAGQSMQLTVSYQFYLNAPGAKLFIGDSGNVGGIGGRFLTLTSTYKFQISHGREAATTGNGAPVGLLPQ